MPSALYFAWQLTYSDYVEWTNAQALYIKDRNKHWVINGQIPQIGNQLQKLYQQSEDSRSKAMKEMKKFLKRLNLSGSQYQAMYNNAIDTVSNQDWYPVEKVKGSSKRKNDIDTN